MQVMRHPSVPYLGHTEVVVQAQSTNNLCPTIFVHGFLPLSSDHSLNCGGVAIVFLAPGLHFILESPGQNHF